MNRRDGRRRRRAISSDSIYIVIIIAPIVLLIALFIYYPAVDTFQTSLTNRNLRVRRPPKAIGFANYSRLVQDDEFWEVTERSFTVVALTLPLEMIVAFSIAMLLNQRFPGRGVVRTLAILPWMLPPVVNGFLWGWLLNGEYGALNGFLYQLGLIDEYRYWLRAPETQILWVTVVQTWTRYAFPTIILLAGLQSIPDDLYDAAKSGWRERSFTLALHHISAAAAVIWHRAGGRVHRRVSDFRCRLDADRRQLGWRRHEPLHQDLDALQL